MCGESTYIGWKILRRAVSPEKPATAMLLPWNACQREITWYLRRLPALDPVLARQAHRVVGGVGAGAGDPDAAVVAQLARRQAHDQVGQVEEGLVGEGVGRVERELLRLVVHGLRDLR